MPFCHACRIPNDRFPQLLIKAYRREGVEGGLLGSAGPKDPRLPKAVWRGSTGGFGGLVKGRAALLNLGLQRPDLIDSGVLDWDPARYGDDGGRLKEKMSFGDQVS